MLAVLTTHPIQYQVPLWRELTRRCNDGVEVWFLSDQGAPAGYDRGFGRTVEWDVDMTGGYAHRFLETANAPTDISRFRGARIGSLELLFRDRRVSALLINGWFPQAYWQAAWQAAAAQIPVLLRAESNDLARPAWWKRTVKRVALTRFFNRVSMFLAVGIANRRLYESFGIPACRLGAAPYCVDNAWFASSAAACRTDRAALRVRWGIPQQATCFLFAGKLIPKKRIVDLLQAFDWLTAATNGTASVRSPHLLIVGDGELRGAVEAYARRICRTSGRACVSVAGFLNQSEMPQAYAVSDCLVLPSEMTETWGLVVNEAMASGLPAIVSDQVGCGPDLIEAGRTGDVFPMGDIPRLAERLRAWLDPGRCRSAQPAVLERVSQYSIERAADGILRGASEAAA